MIKVKKDAIKVKTPEGMQSAGVLCKVGTFGVDNMKFMTQWGNTFYKASFPEETHLVLEYGDTFNGAMTSMFAYTGSSKIKSIKIVGNRKVTSVVMNTTFNNCSAEIIDFSECDADQLMMATIYAAQGVMDYLREFFEYFIIERK